MSKKQIISQSILIVFTSFLVYSCTKEVTLEFPESEQKIVVDGTIEPGSPPFIFLTQSNSFNVGVDPSTLGELLLNGANVIINDGASDFQLQEICVSDLDSIQLSMLSVSIGISAQQLANINYCIYTNFSLIGEVGKTYNLTVEYQNTTLTSATSILTPVTIDSLWFQKNASDSLGLIHGILSDPPGEYNAYRWFAQRISLDTITNEPEDPFFIAPLGSAFDDQFFEGLTFEFFAARGSEFNSDAEEDNNSEAGLFKSGDTVVVKFCSITEDSYRFYFTLEDQILNNGSPFATPGNIPSNINGGLGIWTGYSPYIDTLILP
ncbi:MAG: hypothetical protein ACI9AT_000563 [Ulvibacter sp.]|jgi:hypothetical protein